MLQSYSWGMLVGDAAAQNVELGFIPDRVEIQNLTDGDKYTIGYPNVVSMPFTSGGTTTIAAGHVLRGATTTSALFRVRQVLVQSGSFAGGDAAGFFIGNYDDISGTFGSENVDVYTLGPTNSGLSVGEVVLANGATVSAATIGHTVSIDTEVATETGNAAISAYVGSSGSASKGFTIGSTISEDNKLLRWEAFRNNAMY